VKIFNADNRNKITSYNINALFTILSLFSGPRKLIHLFVGFFMCFFLFAYFLHTSCAQSTQAKNMSWKNVYRNSPTAS